MACIIKQSSHLQPNIRSLCDLTATSEALVPATAEARVAQATIAMGLRLLEARQVVEVAVVVGNTAAGQLVATRAADAVVVGNTGVASHTGQATDSRPATTDVHGVLTPAETHISPPAVVAMGVGLLEPRVLVEVPVVVIDTTTSHGVTARKRRDAHTAASEVVRACCALKGTNGCLTMLIVASEAARTKASVATEGVAVGEHFLEGREVVPVAVVVVHTTTSHGVPTVNVRVDNASVVRGCSPSGTVEIVSAMHVVVAMAAEDHTKAAAVCLDVVSTPAQVTAVAVETATRG